MKNVISLLVLTGISWSVFGQQDPLYSQYLTNPLIFNPAYAGLNNALNASVSYRNQWAGFDGNPTTLNASGHVSLVDNRVGGGLLVLKDQLGITKTTEVHALASYKLQLKEMTVSFGMQMGVVAFRNDYSELTIDPDLAFNQNERASKPNVGVGALVRTNKFLAGFSVPRMIKTKFNTAGQDFELYDQHYYLFGSYVHYLNERLRLKPSLLLRGVQGAPVSVDVNMNINIDTKYSVGAYTRNLKAYGLLLQAWFLEKYRLGYAFEVPTGRSVGAAFSSHELTLAIKTSVFNFHERTFSEF